MYELIMCWDGCLENLYELVRTLENLYELFRTFGISLRNSQTFLRACLTENYYITVTTLLVPLPDTVGLDNNFW